jgi:hypothetical protein
VPHWLLARLLDDDGAMGLSGILRNAGVVTAASIVAPASCWRSWFHSALLVPFRASMANTSAALMLVLLVVVAAAAGVQAAGRGCSPVRRRGVRRSITFAQCGQHGDRESTEPAFSVGTFFAPYCLGIQRRPSRRLPHRPLTHHHLPHSTPCLHSALSRCPGPERSSRRSRPASRTPNRFQDSMCHTPFARDGCG